MSDDRTIEFDTYCFTAASGLYREGNRVAVPPKESELLELLLTHPGTVITHEEIESALWPRQRVSYASIARCVHSLRNILGGDRNEFIETVPKRGYRFCSRVRGSVAKPERRTLLGEPSPLPVANAHYLEGLREANRGQPESQRRACQLFKKAANTDPDFLAPLLAEIECRGHQLVRAYLTPQEARARGMEACQKALTIEPNSVRARAALIWFKCTSPGKAAIGAIELEVLIREAPEHARLHFYLSWMLRALGQSNAAVHAARKSVELDPYSLSNVHALNWALFMAGRVEEALESERRIAAKDPWVDVAHAYIAVFCSTLGRHGEAIEAGQKTLEVSRGNPTMSAPYPYALARAGRVREAKAVFASLNEHEPERMASAHGAAALVAMGDLGKAALWLETARKESCPWYNGLRYDPRFMECLGESPVRDVLWPATNERDLTNIAVAASK